MKKRIIELLNDLEVPFREISHPAVFTVAESKDHLDDKVPVKSLLLKEKKGEGMVLVIVGGDKRINTTEVRGYFGLKSMEFAKPDVLKEVLGVTPGSVSLFSLLHAGSKDVNVLIDKELLVEEEVGFHPNDNTKTIFIPGFAINQIVETTGHRIVVKEL